MKNLHYSLGVLTALAVAPGTAVASSHMDAPLITLDDAANTTDVYAFVSKRGSSQKCLTTALSVYPFEDPGIGPNNFRFDDNVVYALHLSTGNDLKAGKTSISYYFVFKTRFKNTNTILQAYTDVIKDVGDKGQNLTQTYDVYCLDFRPKGSGLRYLGNGIVPPNNQGRVTPEYNEKMGDGPAKEGVASSNQLDRYTMQSIKSLNQGYVSFCGQREDGFYGDINGIFDLLSLRNPGKDSQKGYNVHTIVLQIPTEQIGGDMQQVGVYATTLRQQVEVRFDTSDPLRFGPYVQVGRQGNPLFCEALVAIQDKDRYNRTTPDKDPMLFRKYALQPELAKLLNATAFKNMPINGIDSSRTDLVGIFIPDLIKVDLSTDPVPLAGGGPNHPTNPDDKNFDRRSLFGGDTVRSRLTNQMIPGGWPNGRRFGDDVIDIAVSAVISDLRVTPPVIRTAGDNVNQNDVAYSKVMPYAGTPLNGRNHKHDD